LAEIERVLEKGGRDCPQRGQHIRGFFAINLHSLVGKFISEDFVEIGSV